MVKRREISDDGTDSVSGWHQIGGVWYYFRKVQDGTEGILYKNTHTPGGYWVDENGVWKP